MGVQRGNDGGPYPSEVIFDSAGNMYGTTVAGAYSAGNVFEMTPSGQYWNETVLYTFYGGSDGLYPHGVVFDGQGNLVWRHPAGRQQWLLAISGVRHRLRTDAFGIGLDQDHSSCL